MIKSIYLFIITLSFVLSSNQVFAHASTISKDTLDSYSGRKYMEGSSGFIQFHLSHGCRNDTRTKTYATKKVTTVFPNANDLSGVAYTKDGQGNLYSGNALIGVKPKIDSDWDKIKIFRGIVPEYYNHSAANSDVRSIHWLGGKVPDNMYENLHIKASLPVLDNCVSRLRVYIPIVQYCEDDHILAWMREATSSFPENVISKGYAPYIDIVRNLSKNPLPGSCNNNGQTKEVYPSEADIEKYLPLKDD